MSVGTSTVCNAVSASAPCAAVAPPMFARDAAALSTSERLLAANRSPLPPPPAPETAHTFTDAIISDPTTTSTTSGLGRSRRGPYV